MTVARIITNKISRIAVTAVTVVTAAVLAFGGLSPVGAQAATGTYDCGTYGGGNYDQTDCTDSSSSTSSSSGTSSSSTNSTSTGSGSSTSTSTSDEVVLNDFSEYTSAEGKSLSFTVGDVFHFNLGGEGHTITVKSIDASKLIVTIASTPTDVTIPIGQTVKYDVDQDGTPDIAITYSTVSSDSATATAIFHALSATSATTPSTTGSTSNTSTGGTTSGSQSSANLWWLWIIPIVIGIALLIWAIAAAKRRKAAASNNGDGTNFN